MIGFMARTPSTLHTASLYRLFTRAKLRASSSWKLGQYLGVEHVGQLRGEGIEGRYLAAADLVDGGLGHLAAVASRLHGGVGCAGEGYFSRVTRQD